MSYDLMRFHKAQEMEYGCALAEIRSGRKMSHWIWYIFPQLKGLGFSSTSAYYGIDGAGEARAYLADPVLKARLIEISSALLSLDNHDPASVMGYPDDMKLRSCMTLFHAVDPDEPVFQQVLDVFFGGVEDAHTLELLANEGVK